MALRKYNVRVRGNETVMKLSDEDAKRYGDDATPVEGDAQRGVDRGEAGATQTPEVSDEVAADAAAATEAQGEKARRAPANKARSAQNKAAESA